jgi:hypothetical protein
VREGEVTRVQSCGSGNLISLRVIDSETLGLS